MKPFLSFHHIRLSKEILAFLIFFRCVETRFSSFRNLLDQFAALPRKPKSNTCIKDRHVQYDWEVEGEKKNKKQKTFQCIEGRHKKFKYLAADRPKIASNVTAGSPFPNVKWTEEHGFPVMDDATGERTLTGKRKRESQAGLCPHERSRKIRFRREHKTNQRHHPSPFFNWIGPIYANERGLQKQKKCASSKVPWNRKECRISFMCASRSFIPELLKSSRPRQYLM